MSQRAMLKSSSSSSSYIVKEIHALCTYCGKEIPTPELKVTIGKRLKSVKGSYYEENTVFVSAEEMHKWIEMLFLESEDMKIDIRQMRGFNKQLFWNMIYYFNEYQLPFEFFLPYEDTKQYDLEYEELKRMSSLVKVQIQRDAIDEDLVLA
jgi:hypothetical protein